MNKYKVTGAISAPAEIIDAAVSMLKSFYPDLTASADYQLRCPTDCEAE
jgi:hypothetical protein